jgi:hypothetical protein
MESLEAMQINYQNYNDLRSAGFWNYPQLYNTVQEIDVPPIYAPYGTPGFWQPATVSTPNNSIAPNSGARNNVGAAFSSASSAMWAAAPPATPAVAAATGQPLAPITLVAPLPSITAIPNPNTPAPAPSGMCAVNTWVSSNPMLAAGAALGLFLLLSGGKK